MSHWPPSGRGDFHHNRVASEDEEEETGEVTETQHDVSINSIPPNQHKNQPQPPATHQHRAPSPVESVSRHTAAAFRESFRGARSPGGGRFGGRGRRQQQTFHRDFRGDQQLHRDSSFGSSGGPLPSMNHRDSSFSGNASRGFLRNGLGGRDPLFRDGPDSRDGGARDGPFRDGAHDHHLKEGPSFARASSFSGVGSPRDDFPLVRGADRDTHLGGSLERPADMTKEVSIGVRSGGLSREKSFGQVDSRASFLPKGPEMRESAASHIHSIPPYVRDNKPVPMLNSPTPTGVPPLSRPTDPRRRATSNDTISQFGQDGVSACASSEGIAEIPALERRSSYNEPSLPTGTSSPSHSCRHLSYSSLASDGPSMPQSRPLGGLRLPADGIRRAVSETAIPCGRRDFPDRSSTAPRQRSPSDLSRSFLTSESDDTYVVQHGALRPAETFPASVLRQGRQLQTDRLGPEAVNSFSTPRIAIRTHDPRLMRTDVPSDEATHFLQDIGSLQSIPERLAVEESLPFASTDSFGRTREWSLKPSTAATSTSCSLSQSSSTDLKQAKAFVSSPTTEKRVGPAPKLPSQSSNEGEATQLKELLQPILISALGTTEKIERAQAVLARFHEVVPGGRQGDGKNSTDKLPTKAMIMSAVNAIESLIKQTKEESEENEEAVKASKKELERKKTEEASKHEEECKKTKMDVEQKLKQRTVEENELKEKIGQEAEDQFKTRYEAEKKQFEESFWGQLRSAKEEEKARCHVALELKVNEMNVNFDLGVAKARRHFDKSWTSAQKVSKKLVAAEIGYKTSMENEEKSMKKEESSKKDFIPVETVIETILAENQRKAKEAHLHSFSLSDAGQNLTYVPMGSSEVENRLKETRDPRYNKTFEEWSVMAMQVNGIADALYSEPSESPYYEQNKRNHAVVGPVVKEYVYDKKRRLTEHWTVLAEEYEVRKRLYEKHQRRLARKARGAITMTSRPSIIGSKTEKREKNEDKLQEPAARSSNNPYRRARRGNEVRSEYEQEQIIAEIAAKEAMERRITHGGSRIPRQICPLERVCESPPCHLVLFCRPLTSI
jgi:hypothetical protein